MNMRLTIDQAKEQGWRNSSIRDFLDKTRHRCLKEQGFGVICDR